MVKRILFSLAGVLAAGHFALHALNAAPPPCGRHACSAQIAACQISECGSLTGKSAADCRRSCVAAVQAACAENSSLCAASPSGAFVE